MADGRGPGPRRAPGCGPQLPAPLLLLLDDPAPDPAHRAGGPATCWTHWRAARPASPRGGGCCCTPLPRAPDHPAPTCRGLRPTTPPDPDTGQCATPAAPRAPATTEEHVRRRSTLARAALAACGRRPRPPRARRPRRTSVLWRSPPGPQPTTLRPGELEAAERVAVLEWQQTEDLLTLCAPVAVADVRASARGSPRAAGHHRRGHPRRTEPRGAVHHHPDLIVVEAYTPEDESSSSWPSTTSRCSPPWGRAGDPIGNMKTTFG